MTNNTHTHFNRTTSSVRGLRRAGVALAGISLVLAACGGSDTATPAEEPAAVPEAAAVPVTDASETASDITPAATIGETELGEVLVGERGLTLYGFTNDNDATSVCYGTCADAWPPVIVDADWQVAPGLDAGIFNAIVRDDGQLQLVAGKWPLYYFAGDATAGDINGQTSGDVWFAVGTDGVLIQDAAPAADAAAEEPVAEEPAEEAAPVTTTETDLGSILVDSAGLTLYGFTNDTDGNPTCNDACADAWPALTVPDVELPAGLDDTLFSVVTRDDGTNQLKAGAWPLYYFAGDAAPGDTNGQQSGDVWFVVAADGSLVKEAPAAETHTDNGY